VPARRPPHRADLPLHARLPQPASPRHHVGARRPGHGIRFPNSTHRAVAGTDVVTDLIVLRRRPPDGPVADAGLWHRPAELDTSDGPVAVNEWFVDHPDLISGSPTLGGAYRDDDLRVTGTLDPDRLRYVLAAEAAGASARGHTDRPMQRPTLQRAPVATVERDAAAGGKPGAIVELADHTFGRISATGIEAFATPVSARRELRELCGIRDVLSVLLDVQATTLDDARLQELQHDLSGRYDSYTAKFGPLKALATGDDRIVRKAGLDADVARLRRKRSAHLEDQSRLQRTISRNDVRTHQLTNRAALLDTLVADTIDTRGDRFAMIVTGFPYTERVTAGTHVLTVVEEAMNRARTQHAVDIDLGDLAGICWRLRCHPASPCLVELDITATGERITLDRPDLPKIDPARLVQRLEKAVAKLPSVLADTRHELAAIDTETIAARQRLGVAFRQRDELAHLESELQTLDAELAAQDRETLSRRTNLTREP
jgi:hypothetical protein